MRKILLIYVWTIGVRLLHAGRLKDGVGLLLTKYKIYELLNTDMETTSTLSQELLRAVTAEPEIAEKVQALVETIEGMIRSK
jgi:hypothetical protein